MRRAARKDANKDAIVSALRAAGCFVYDLKMPCDLWIRTPDGSGLFVEVKDGSKPPSARKLTPGQVEFSEAAGPFFVTVKSVEEAREICMLTVSEATYIAGKSV